MTKIKSKRMAKTRRRVKTILGDEVNIGAMSEDEMNRIIHDPPSCEFGFAEEDLEKKKNPISHEVYNKSYSDWRHYAIPFFPLSHNNAYSQGKTGRRFMITEYEEYSKATTRMLRLIDNEHDLLKLYGDSYEIRFFTIITKGVMFYKNGNFRRWDVDGVIKLAMDAVFAYLEIDDCTVLDVTSRKLVVDKLPWPELRYSESPVWDLKGGVLGISVRTVPKSSVSKLTEDYREFSEGVLLSTEYVEPRLNMRRGKKEQKSD